MAATRTAAADIAPLLQAVLNLSRFHREHEEFYASAPREQAVTLQRHARTLHALADRWSTCEPASGTAFSPFEGADDLNAPAALQLDGVLFMEGEGRPAEITHMIRDLRSAADDTSEGGRWLRDAMQAAWAMAETFLDVDELADVLGQRHRIIINDWQAAHLYSLVGELLTRAAAMLERVDFTPTALRRDLACERSVSARLWSAAELIDRAADLLSDAAGLVHDNEPRWRQFRRRVSDVVERSGAMVGA